MGAHMFDGMVRRILEIKHKLVFFPFFIQVSNWSKSHSHGRDYVTFFGFVGNAMVLKCRKIIPSQPYWFGGRQTFSRSTPHKCAVQFR